MKRTSKFAHISGVVAIALASLMLPGAASADELMLSEITVIALALDTESKPRDAAVDQSLEGALETIREDLKADTDSHLKDATTVPTRLTLVASNARDRG